MPAQPGDDRRPEDARYEERREREYRDRKKKKSSPMAAFSDIMELFGGGDDWLRWPMPIGM